MNAPFNFNFNKIINPGSFPRQVRMKLLYLLIFVFVGLSLFSYAYVIEGRNDTEESAANRYIVVDIPKGATTRDIAEIIKNKGAIKYPFIYRIVSRIFGHDGHYIEGTHVLEKGMSYRDIAKALCSRAEIERGKMVTIVEGLTLEQIAEKLEKEKIVNRERFLKVLEETQFNYRFLEGLNKVNGRNYKLEGYLFPDTYELNEISDENIVAVKMLDRFDEMFEPGYYERACELGMTTDQVVILASIIEKEAWLQNERAIISSVFHNRIKKGMRLESCATVQYLLGAPKEVLSTQDTKIESPYNTYINYGLPPGPICSPGKASIHAALYPEKTEYLYFFANKDGSHMFSKTYREHINALNRSSRNR